MTSLTPLLPETYKQLLRYNTQAPTKKYAHVSGHDTAPAATKINSSPTLLSYANWVKESPSLATQGSKRRMRMLLVQSYSRLEAKDVLTTLALIDGVVDRVDTSEEACNHISHHRYDIILLNDLVPDDACRLARRLRTALGSTPVIILSARSEPKIKAQAFSAGVDAYLTKPFDPGELTARIQTVARGLQACPHILRVGPLQINRDSGEVKVGQNNVSLTGKEFGVLELLVMRRGTALSKEVFLEHLYRGTDKPEPKIIDVFVCKIRHKLVHAGCEGLIKTIWGRGYMISDPRIVELEEPPPATSTDGRTLIAA